MSELNLYLLTTYRMIRMVQYLPVFSIGTCDVQLYLLMLILRVICVYTQNRN